MRGLYVHVPLCMKKCDYCDFYSLPARLDSRESFVRAVLGEASLYAGLSFETMYIGGGTPSLLGPGLLNELIAGLRDRFDLSHLVEATIEVNPESATSGFLGAAMKAGFNRLSVGVQSLADSELEGVGRLHTGGQAVAVVKTAIGLGFRSVSADLIVGLPRQTWATLRQSLEVLIGLGVHHLSAYCLTLEDGTPLDRTSRADLPDDDAQVELFERTRLLLGRHGFVHYEISNFALAGHECLHNLNYWRGGEYLGLGPSAASHLGGRRFRVRPDLDAYLRDPTGQEECFEELCPPEKASEEAILRLRLLTEGIDARELAARFGIENVAALVKRLDRLVSAGLLDFAGSTYRLPPSRVLTSNPVLAEVLDAAH